MLRSKTFWIITLTVLIIINGIGWLLGSYKPPFPPHWIGVKYYQFSSEQGVPLEDLSSLSRNLNTMQNAYLVFEPVSDDANAYYQKNLWLIPSPFLI